MAVRCICPKCGKGLNVPDGLRSHKIQCPGCRTRFRAMTESDRLKTKEIDEKDIPSEAEIISKLKSIPEINVETSRIKTTCPHCQGTIWANVPKDAEEFTVRCSTCEKKFNLNFAKATNLDKWRKSVDSEAVNYFQEIPPAWIGAILFLPFVNLAFPITAIIQGRKGGCTLLVAVILYNAMLAGFADFVISKL